MKLNENRIRKFQQKILQFYKENKRNLPWRHTTDPYKILLSEIMLQQTQVSRVIEYYERWLHKWPTIEKLAKAKRIDVLKTWLGLGYNSRAIHLHRASQIIVDEYGGDIIKAMEHYKEIPGIGPYTSHAVQVFSQNKDIIVVDTNIRRILIHEFKLKEYADNGLKKLAEICLPIGRSRDWHNALMDYGSVILTSRKTGIKPKTRQSIFEGSDRQIRSQILRYILQKQKPLKFIQLRISLKNMDNERLKRILDGLVKDRILKLKNHRYTLET